MIPHPPSYGLSNTTTFFFTKMVLALNSLQRLIGYKLKISSKEDMKTKTLIIESDEHKSASSHSLIHKMFLYTKKKINKLSCKFTNLLLFLKCNCNAYLKMISEHFHI